MVGYERAAIVADDDEQFDTKHLMRLAAWGSAAFLSLALAVAAARSDFGEQRIAAAARAAAAGPNDVPGVSPAQILTRVVSAEREAHRAAEISAAISADRERTAVRIRAAEHAVASLHASVEQALTLASEAKAVSSPLSFMSANLMLDNKIPAPSGWASPPAMPGHEASTASPGPASPSRGSTARTLPPAPAPVPATHPGGMPMAAAKPAPTATPDARIAVTAKPAIVANEPASITGSVAANNEPLPKVEFGVDLGPALTMSRLSARWKKLSAERPELVKGLWPVVIVHDTAPGKPVEVRLLVGPLATVNAATEFCQALASPHYICRPSVFDGQRLRVQ
jgi:hypothetical protein